MRNGVLDCFEASFTSMDQLAQAANKKGPRSMWIFVRFQLKQKEKVATRATELQENSQLFGTNE